MKAAAFLILATVIATPAWAQSEPALREFFEGKTIAVKIDMPATSQGIDVFADAARAVDYKAYGDRIKASGTSIKSGDSTIVTLVRMKDKSIEFQLGGGGFGTFSDDTSTSVYVPSANKTTREKNLERDIKKETDSSRKRDLQEELDRLKRDREREDRRNEASAKEAEEEKKSRIAEQRLRGGSRFNLRYQNGVPRGITPQEVMAALAEFVDFSAGLRPVVALGASTPAAPIAMASAGPAASGGLRKGMSWQEAKAIFGQPESSSERMEGALKVVTAIFARADQRIEAQFVEGVLIKYAVSSR